MKNKPVFENFFGWKGLPALLTVAALIIGIIVYMVELSSKVGVIEKDHMIFGEIYQRQVDDIKASQLRTEMKLDKLIDKFIGD